MALKLYRRHRIECEGGHPEETRSGEFEEGRRGWKRCACLIHVAGTLKGKFSRKQTGQWEWEAAKTVASKLESSGSWETTPEPAFTQAVEPQTAKRTTIADATQSYLSRCENRGIAVPTLRKYKTFVKQLKAFCDAKGYVMVDQLTVADMDVFYSSWKDAKRARAKKLERLKSFVKFCVKREWLPKDISDDLKAPEGSSVPANKTPFTDEELDRIYAACDLIGPPKPPGPGYRPWGGEDVKDFVYLSIFTGLRISDVSTFNIAERLKGNDVFLRMHKTQRELYTWIPSWLISRLRAREKKHGVMIFRSGQALNMRAISERWRENLAKVFKLAGPFAEPPVPHRFRHTFVRILLEKGVPVADAAELVGDSEAILKKHYAKWMPARQARLSKILQDAFSDKPKPKIVSIA